MCGHGGLVLGAALAAVVRSKIEIFGVETDNRLTTDFVVPVLRHRTLRARHKDAPLGFPVCHTG